MNNIDIYLHYIDFYIILYTPSDLQGQTYFIYGKLAAFRRSNPISAAAYELPNESVVFTKKFTEHI